MAAPYDRQVVVASVDLVALADEVAGPTRPSRWGSAWDCPAEDHADRSHQPPEMVVYTTRAGEQRWQCTSCGAGGTAIELLAAARGITDADALWLLANRQTTGPAQPLHPDTAHEGTRPVPDLERLADEAAARLWTDDGTAVRAWLTDERGLPEPVLRANRIGATTLTPPGTLATRRAVAGPRAPTPAAFLPVLHQGGVVGAELRLIGATGPGRYMHPTAGHGPLPTLGRYRPDPQLHDEIVVTEGTIDALSAAAAGYRAVATYGPARATVATAVQLARLDARLVLALDADPAGRAATDRLARTLTAMGRPPTTLALAAGDLNDTHTTATNWPRYLTAHISHATAAAAAARPPALGR